MKRVLGLLVALGIMFAAIGGLTTAWAAETGQFTITVTVNFLEVSLKDTTDTDAYITWAIPQMSTAASEPMANLSGVYVNLGTTNANVDINTWISSTAATTWVVADSPGADTYSLIATGTSVATDVTVWTGATSLDTSTHATIISGTSTSVSNFLYYKFYSPTSTTTGAQQTITITVEIVAT